MPDRDSPLNRFNRIIRESIDDFIKHGFDSQERLEHWVRKIYEAAKAALMPEAELQQRLDRHLTGLFDELVRRPMRFLRVHPGVSAFTLENVMPQLRLELNRRILASAKLIKLNRDTSMSQTLQRFAGWATSIPAGGSRAVDKREEAETVRRGIAGLPMAERRCVIDQGHKLVASIHNVIAMGGGAIALTWHHVKEGAPEYEARPDHLARDGQVFVIRDNWALKRGLMKLDGHQYYDEVTAVAVEPFCRCSASYIYSIGELPPEMLTAAGEAELARVRAVIASA